MMMAMNVTVNGQTSDLPASCSIESLLDSLNLAEAACAVEVNATLVPKRQHADHSLIEGDIVEVVSLVGGG